MGVCVMSMPCTSLGDIIEVSCKIFTPSRRGNHSFSPLLIYSIVFDHLALRGTLRYFEPCHTRLTEGCTTDEVIAYVDLMANIARTVKSKRVTVGAMFVSSPGYMYLPRPLQQFMYLVMEAVYVRNFSFYV